MVKTIFNERVKTARNAAYTEMQLLRLTKEQKEAVDRASADSGVPINEIFRRGFGLWVTQNMGVEYGDKLSH